MSPRKSKILAVDDDRSILNFLNIFLLQTGKFEVDTCFDSTKVFKKLEEGYDILLLDMDMPEVNGIDILKYIDENNIGVVTVVLTGVEDVDLAISAMKLGTYDYLLKPIEEDKLIEVLDKAAEDLDLKKIGVEKDVEKLFDKLEYKKVFSDIITKNQKMIKIFQYVEQIAKTESSVLIWGESGTGKELIARAIHKISKRKDLPFVAVNAGAFANELFSSEFFGYKKGAFTGANRDKTGFIEKADKGTLFLDEIGELSLPIQVKLLRFLQEGEFFKLGSTKQRQTDVRIIAATNKDLFDEIKKGNFRKDLFFRLNINSIFLPPLRERLEDIEILSDYFIKKFNRLHDKNISGSSKEVMELLKGYNYPGNVRELMNIINSSVIIEKGNKITKQSLPHYFLKNTSKMNCFNGREQYLNSLEEVEKSHIKKVLEVTNWNKTKASKILGISRVSLISKVKKYNLVK